MKKYKKVDDRYFIAMNAKPLVIPEFKDFAFFRIGFRAYDELTGRYITGECKNRDDMLRKAVQVLTDPFRAELESAVMFGEEEDEARARLYADRLEKRIEQCGLSPRYVEIEQEEEAPKKDEWTGE